MASRYHCVSLRSIMGSAGLGSNHLILRCEAKPSLEGCSSGVRASRLVAALLAPPHEGRGCIETPSWRPRCRRDEAPDDNRALGRVEGDAMGLAAERETAAVEKILGL